MFNHPTDFFYALNVASTHPYVSAGMLVTRLPSIKLSEARQVLEELETMGCLTSSMHGKTARYTLTEDGSAYYGELLAEVEERRRRAFA